MTTNKQDSQPLTPVNGGEKWKIDFDHTNGKAPFTIAVGNCDTGDGWEQKATVYNELDANLICYSVNNFQSLKEENERLKEALRDLLQAYYDKNDGELYEQNTRISLKASKLLSKLK